jgi:iron-sulfur cluster repair protein YtfE (RIC family)
MKLKQLIEDLKKVVEIHGEDLECVISLDSNSEILEVDLESVMINSYINKEEKKLSLFGTVYEEEEWHESYEYDKISS